MGVYVCSCDDPDSERDYTILDCRYSTYSDVTNCIASVVGTFCAMYGQIPPDEVKEHAEAMRPFLTADVKGFSDYIIGRSQEFVEGVIAAAEAGRWVVIW